MKKILAIEHIACEPLGRFESEAAGLASFSYLRPYRGEPVPGSFEGWDGIIILGGPIAVYEASEYKYLENELRLIRRAIDADFPVLGICLGSQLIAAAAGARVYPGGQRETGWDSVALTGEAAADPLFSGLPDPLPVFQLHGDTFDLPAGAVRLASSSAYANQAFRLGQNLYGLQFHVEVTGSLVKDWSGVYHDYIIEAGTDPSLILESLTDQDNLLQPIASQIINRFLKLKAAGG